MLFIYLISLVTVLKFVSSQGVGNVYIGNSSNIASSLTFNENTAPALLVIPVFIEARDPTDSSVISIVGNVVVNCELSTSGSGFSSGTFQPLTLNNATKSGNLPFSVPVLGQEVDIRCYGESTSEQFNKTVSISSPSSFTVTKAPTVSICPTGTKDVVDIITQSVTQNFTVRLSDAAADNAVLITCTGATGTLVFQPATVAVGAREVQVSVTLNINTPLTGTCQGQSQGGGLQYRNASSQGVAVTFQLIQPVVTLYPPSITSSTTSFTLILLLTSKPPASLTSFRCRADLLATITDVQNAILTPLCRNPSATLPTPAQNATDIIESTPNWGILTPNVTLDANVHHARLTAVRNIITTSPVEENVVVSCCSTSGTLGLESTVWARVSLTPNATVDWEKSTDLTKSTDPPVPKTNSTNFTTPRKIQNVAYVDIAPCPCNLVDGVCDINCCCDGDCSSAQQQTFTRCIPYLEGGQTAALPEYMCKSDHFNKEDWFHLMCVQSEYNSLIGFFYQNDPVLRTTQTYTEKIASRDPYSYRETEDRVQKPYSTETTGYRQTEKVLSVRNAFNGIEKRRGVVSLPQRILSGECSREAPLQYLKDVDTDCSFELTTDMCSDNSVFNAQSYMQSSTTTDPSCPTTFSVMGNPTTENVAETVVNYYCTNDATEYVKTTTTIATPSTRSLFNYVYPVGCPADDCGREIGEATPCTGYDDTVTQETLPPRCTFNDHYTRPPSPSVNGATCENVVVDVKYNFYWSGPDIMKLNATVFLANIPISTATNPVVITQKYKASFIHSFTGLSNNTQDNYYNVETPFSRSGKPGYDIGKPMVSGMVTRNDSNNVFLYINSNSSRQMALWDTGFNGLCLNAGRREITFGQDTLTSCNINVGIADLENCTDLSKLIINRLDNLMPADRIGRYGNNNPYGLTQWIEILRENLTDTCTDSLETTNQTVLSWKFAGFCTNVVSGISLDVMYGESGMANGVPTNEIIGASISYTKSTWQLRCGSGSTSRCSDPLYVEPFPVTAAVRFIKVPANTPVQKIKWKVENPDICFRDKCWENFIYPLTRAYSAEPRQYVLAMTLLLILFFFGFLFITRPWW